uniref:C2 NT-type domain-containing protein n=1 Tax=Panagrolaimus davidi TaxID=227884 RepID=A0A914QMN3_9BILA
MMKYEAPDQTLDLTEINETQNTSVLQSFNVTIRSRYSSAINYPREVIAMALKRVKRNGHQPSKYCFNISLKELVIYGKKKPEKVQIAVMHRQRRYTCESRPLERSFSNANKYMIVWPDFAADTIKFTTTFFKNPSNKQFDNKEWTIIVEEITKKGKIRPLAAVQLNFAFFVNQNPNLKTELKLKLRSLQKDVNNCMLSLIVSSTFVNEGHEMDDDLQSQAAYIPTNIPFLSHDSEIFTEDVKMTEFEDCKDGRNIIKQASLIKQAWNQSSAEVADSFKKHSKTNVSPEFSPLLSDSKLEGKNCLVFPVAEQNQRRKIVTSFEKNIINVENINDELQKIAERIKEVEYVSQHVQEKIKSVGKRFLL